MSDAQRTGTNYATKALDRARLGRFDSSDIYTGRPAVGAFLAGLAALGLDDPTGATEPYERARELMATRPVERIELDESGLANDLAAGSVDPGGAAKVITRGAVESTTKAQQETQRRVLRAAAIRANAAAADMIRAAGDSLIVDLLRPEAEKVLAEPIGLASSDRWALIHDTAKVLRGGALVPTCGASVIEHTFTDVYAVHLHRLAVAERTKVVGGFVEPSTNTRWLTLVPVDAKPLTVIDAAQHPEWGPGVWTADEVLRNLRAVELHLDALVRMPRSGRPGPGPSAA